MDLPKETTQKITWLFLLAPGFISFTVIGWIVDLGQLSEFQITYYSFVLTVVNLSIAAILLWLTDRIRKRLRKEWHLGTLVLALLGLISSLVLGVILGYAAERDLFFVTLRVLPITTELNKRSSARPTTFLLSQNTRGQLAEDGDARPKGEKTSDAFVRVTTSAGEQYEGWPEYYGLGNKRSELYLSPACVVTNTRGVEQVRKITGPGVILYEDGVRSIIFLDRACSTCYLRWYPQSVLPDSAARCKQ